jgi:hypothetical protein
LLVVPAEAVAFVPFVRALVVAPFVPMAPAAAVVPAFVPAFVPESDWLPVVAFVELLSDWLPVVVVLLLLSDWSPVAVALSIVTLERPRRSICGLNDEVEPVTVFSEVDVEPVTVAFVLAVEPLTVGLVAFVLFVCAMAGPVAPSTAAAMTLSVKGIRFIQYLLFTVKRTNTLCLGQGFARGGCAMPARTGCD